MGILFNRDSSPLTPKRFVTQKIVASACRIAVSRGNPAQVMEKLGGKA